MSVSLSGKGLGKYMRHYAREMPKRSLVTAAMIHNLVCFCFHPFDQCSCLENMPSSMNWTNRGHGTATHWNKPVLGALTWTCSQVKVISQAYWGTFMFTAPYPYSWSSKFLLQTLEGFSSIGSLIGVTIELCILGPIRSCRPTFSSNDRVVPIRQSNPQNTTTSPGRGL